MRDLIKKILFALLVGIIVFFLFYNCSSEQKKENTEVKKDSAQASVSSGDCKSLLENAVRMDSIILAATAVNKDEGNKAIKAFVDFSSICPDDSLAPVFLIKSAQIAQAINNLPQAKLSLEKCILDFPKFRNRGAAMFLLAQLYDDPRYLNNEEKAIELYKEIISVYPKTPWAANAAAAQELAGKSDEQIIREFEKKNEKK
jgi:outer membrane protein assembly factor BamD (BamD/ComL family)